MRAAHSARGRVQYPEFRSASNWEPMYESEGSMYAEHPLETSYRLHQEMDSDISSAHCKKA